VVAGPQVVDQSSRRVQDRLESTHKVSWKADQHAVSIVQPGVHQCNHEHEVWSTAHSDESDVVDVARGSIATRYVGRVSASTGRSRRRCVVRDRPAVD